MLDRWRRLAKPTNVFVLCTGRSGSTTFAAACGHLTNFTAGHETLAAEILAARLNYPADHIEADNRLSWHLGSLGKRFDDSNVLYVHLTRDREAVAQSFVTRWDSTYGASMIRAFGHGILTRSADWPLERREDVARHYVDTVTANIEDFLRNRPSLSVTVEGVTREFPRFLDRIGAEGDLESAVAEWNTRWNASEPASQGE